MSIEGCWSVPALFLKVGQGPLTQLCNIPQNTLLVWGRATDTLKDPWSGSLGPRLGNIGLALWVAEISWFEGNLLLE